MGQVDPISIIVPVLNEAALLPAFLRHVRQRAPDAELILVDGGSTDGSRALLAELAPPLGGRVMLSPPGRARQMNRGAWVAQGLILWFLHVDSLLPDAPLEKIRRALSRDSRLAGGCFRLRIERPEWIYRVSDSLGNLGVDRFGIALGDHGIFCRRTAFEQVGGFPDVPLLEDAELYRRLRRHGELRQLRSAIVTSPRRYLKYGPYRTTLVYALILALYVARVPIPALERICRLLLR